MDLETASRLLEGQKLKGASAILSMLVNNYKKFTNVRVVSNVWKENLAQLARALRHDFDGSGPAYIAEHTIWKVGGATGSFIFLKASLLDREAILMSQELDKLRSMTAFEILQLVRIGRISVQRALEIARSVGVEMRVDQDEDGSLLVSFFGGQETPSRLTVIEPPELIWD